MKVRKVSVDLLDPAKPSSRSAPSPREQRRLALEKKLEQAVRRASADPTAAFRLDMEEDEKVPTIRAAFGRVRERVGANEVNLFARDGALIVAKRPQTRGRRAKASS